MRDFEPVLTSILSAASSALNEAGVPAGLVSLTPGTSPAWDNCCEGGGQLWLRVVEVYPTAGTGSAFPQVDTAQKGVGAGCGIHLLAVRLALGVMRCAHTISDQGVPPTAAEMSSDALATLDDLGILLDVIGCTIPTLTGVLGAKVDRWTPQGVLGGCAGGEWGFYIAVDPCLCKPLPAVYPPEPEPVP
jgi:hypothetical protein